MSKVFIFMAAILIFPALLCAATLSNKYLLVDVDGETGRLFLSTVEGHENIEGDEKVSLLFFDRPPLELAKEKFKKSIGPAKYRAYLNYLYGVLVEEALISAVVDEVRKERRSLGINKHADDLDKAYRRIYGASKQALLDDFRKAKRYPSRKSITLSEFKEFTYWLFKHRLETCDKSRVASDTKKALLQMQRNMSSAKRKA